ncbi:efflux RND transporter permease subunit [Haliangium sp. UPWRP_2]|uniref:efflux RND transporter permease subunit n=1 Tax=Haliangium sp. UPWRP_2 TaxID=1931276 RepID=UPI000B5449C0
MRNVPSSMGNTSASELMERFRLQRAAVPLGVLADVRVVTGPPMIKDENGVLAGYVFADVDTARRKPGGWVAEAKTLVKKNLAMPSGYRLVWTGQYEFMAEMEARMRYVLPPFAVAGSFFLLWARGYNLSTAVWVGLV